MHKVPLVILEIIYKEQKTKYSSNQQYNNPRFFEDFLVLYD